MAVSADAIQEVLIGVAIFIGVVALLLRWVWVIVFSISVLAAFLGMLASIIEF